MKLCPGCGKPVLGSSELPCTRYERMDERAIMDDMHSLGMDDRVVAIVLHHYRDAVVDKAEAKP